MNGIVAVAAMLRAALGVHEIRACRSLSLPPSLTLSLFLLIFHFLSLYLSPSLLIFHFLSLGLSLFLSTLLLTLSHSTPPFCLSPNALFTPSPALRESKLLSAGWPAVLP